MQPFPNYNYFTQYQTPSVPQYNVAQSPYNAPQQGIARLVGDFNEVTVGDIPTNGTPGFFIKSDYSQIQARRWSDDGRIISMNYVLEADTPAEEKKDPFAEIMNRLDAIDEKLPARRKKETMEE